MPLPVSGYQPRVMRMIHASLIGSAVGGHPGMAGSFAILRFEEPSANDVVYIESQAGDLFLESETDRSRFAGIFEHLRALALPPEQSVALIQRIAGEMMA